MGLFTILFGGSSKPRITEKEFKKVRSALQGEGFSSVDRNKIEALFSGDMYESGANARGIDAKELAEKLKWLRAHKSKHGFSNDEIDKIEACLEKYL